jgi:dihydroneopterin triphosphate diphosphatase
VPSRRDSTPSWGAGTSQRDPLTGIRVAVVDVYVLRPVAGGWDALCLRRSPQERSAGTWETVHGHILDGESPVAAAVRELAEETGLAAERLYNVSRVESFYLHRTDEVVLIPVFCALVSAGAEARVSEEHDAAAWLPPAQASERFAWPRERRALADALALVGRGDAGGLEDVLRVR